MNLLKEMCSIIAPSGNETAMTDFLLNYINQNRPNWKTQPQLFYGEDFQDCIILVFGKPRTAIFAHIDSIGFTVRYGTELVGEDSLGKITCTLQINENGKLSYSYHRTIERGTTLTFKSNFRATEYFIQSCYLDNRLGVWNALKVAETLEDGIIAFSCWEEHGGGSVEYLARFIYEKYYVKQALISDITWVTTGVEHNKGVAISLRDSGLPRKSYVNKIVAIAKNSNIPFQLEVEGSGGSDGNALQRSPYPFDWCFVGAPENFVHSANEQVHKNDVQAMLNMYKLLMQEL